MPPSIKTDRNAILQAAFNLTKGGGLEMVTARQIAQSLGCSTQPIFREFENMDALRAALYEYSNHYFAQYLMAPRDEGDPFFNVGFRYIQFASEEKNLFKMMFMSNLVHADNLIELFTSDKDNIEIMKSIPHFSKCSTEQIEGFFTKVAIFTHGIASLIATNDLAFDGQMVAGLLKDLFRALSKDLGREESSS